MDIKQMEYYIAVVEEGTFQAAAAKLHMTQPPLSAQIRLLEEELGSVLLLRGARHVQMTDTGELFYRRAKNILDLAQITRKEVEDHKAGEFGTLRIGIISSANDFLLQKWITPFTKMHPHIRFELTEANTYQLTDMIHTNLLDVAFVRTPFTRSPDFDTVTLYEDLMIAVGEKKYFKKNTGVSIKELTGMPLIVYRRWKDLLTMYFTDEGAAPEYFCLADDARTCLSWASKGLGVAIMPESAYTSSITDNKVLTSRQIKDPEIPSAICAITNKNGYQSSALTMFMKQCQHLIYVSSASAKEL